MDYDRKQLEADLENWLKDKVVLQKARQLLGEGALGDADLANWRRRGTPPALIKGAALQHYGRDTSVQPAVQAQVVGHESWQVFTVSPQVHKAKKPDGTAQKNHDGTVLKLWTGVRKSASADEAFLTHRTWYSGEYDSKPQVFTLGTDTPLEAHPIQATSKGGIVAIAWKLKDNKQNDFGYRVRIKSTVSRRGTDGPSYEYLGGIVGIPVDRLILVIRLPHNLMAKPGILSRHKFKIPRCLQFLPDGVPFQTLEEYLAGDLDIRWLGPYFRPLGDATLATESNIVVPDILRRELSKAESGEDTTYTEFIMEIPNPAPYLCYALVFDLPNDD